MQKVTGNLRFMTEYFKLSKMVPTENFDFDLYDIQEIYITRYGIDVIATKTNVP